MQDLDGCVIDNNVGAVQNNAIRLLHAFHVDGNIAEDSEIAFLDHRQQFDVVVTGQNVSRQSDIRRNFRLLRVQRRICRR